MRIKPGRGISFPWRVAGMLACVAVYRLSCVVPLPFVGGYPDGTSGGMLAMLSGGGSSWAALGVTPYIMASIVMQFASILVKPLAQLQKAGAVGRSKVRSLTLFVCAVFGILMACSRLSAYASAGSELGLGQSALVAVILAATSVGVAALSFVIDDFLIGNGISLFLAVGIAGSVPSDMMAALSALSARYGGLYAMAAFLLAVVAILLFVSWLNACSMDVPVSYSQKADESGGRGTIPLRLLSTGVMPVVFASSFLAIPAVAGSVFWPDAAFFKAFDMGSWFRVDMPWATAGALVYLGLILAFGRYSQLVSMNEVEMAENLRQAGCVIDGVRPGPDTAVDLRLRLKALNRLGSIALWAVSVVPVAASGLFGVGSVGMLGTSAILLVSIVQDTWREYRIRSVSYGYMKAMPVVDGRRSNGRAFALLEKGRV